MRVRCRHHYYAEGSTHPDYILRCTKKEGHRSKWHRRILTRWLSNKSWWWG